MVTINPCCCCLLQLPEKYAKTPYTWLCKKETISDLLEDCFQIHLTLGTDVEFDICDVCMGRLRDASDFKLQVLRSQAELQVRTEIVLHVNDADKEPKVKTEMLDEILINRELDNDNNMDEDFMVGLELGSPSELLPTSESVQHIPHTYTQIKKIPKTTRYSCNTCGAQFKSKTGIIMHLKKHKQNTDVCSKTSQKDLICFKNEMPFTCEVCDKQFELKRYLGVHKRVHRKKYVCKICEKQFRNQYFLKIHTHVHIGKKPYSCEACGKQFRLQCHVKRHNCNVIGKTLYTCQICEKQFKSNYRLDLHTRIHTNSKPHSCEVCHKQFTLKCNLVAHKCIGKSPNTFEVREKQFERNHDLDSDKGFHSEENSYTYEACEKQFYQNTHETIHLDIKPLICEVLGRPFAIKNNLKDLDYDEETSYTCEICSMKFTQKKKFERHTHVHTGEMRYVCELCNKPFKNKYHLETHRLIHSTLKPFLCEACPKQFRTRGQLEAHIRTHTGEKPYVCEACGKQFRQKSQVDAHIRTHTGQRPYVCEVCYARFRQISALNKHILTHSVKKESREG